MNRRKFAAVMSGVVLTGTAGCGSDNPSGGDGNSEANTATPTETDTASEPAEFVIREYNVPDTVQIGEDALFEVTILNMGGRRGDFSARLYGRTPESEWQAFGEWTASDVSPGESVTMTSNEPIEFDYLGRFEYRLGESSNTTVIQTVSAKLEWGEEYTTPEGYLFRVNRPELQGSYMYEDFSGTQRRKKPENGGQWAFVDVYVKNNTGSAEFSPLATDIKLLYGDSQADGETILIDEPINKGQRFDGGELQPGVKREGWILYPVPSNLSIGDLTVAWSETEAGGRIAVNWSG